MDTDETPRNRPPASPSSPPRLLTGWTGWLARASLAALLFETLTGLAIPLLPFLTEVQWGVLLHTAVGAATLLPIAWYCCRHLADYRTYAPSHITVLGWLGLLGLAVVSATGVVLTVQAVLGVKTSPLWRQVHLIATLVMLTGVAPHLLAAV